MTNTKIDELNKKIDELMYELQDMSGNLVKQHTSSVDRFKQVGGYHYTSKEIQPWDAMQSWMSEEQFEGYIRGNAIKYLARYPEKGGRYDIEKSQHYLDKLLQIV